jgi:hypothetical protein
MQAFILYLMLVFSTVMLTLSLASYIDIVPHEQPMIDFCQEKDHELRVYDSFGFECTDGGRYNKDVLKESK